MTAMVSGDRAKAAGLTGIAGSLILAGAVVMMAVAAPATPHQQHASTASTATGSCHQLTSRSASASGRACLAGPSAVSARADAYTSESWSASRSARPPLARAAVS
jgi:uncharacterized low-complexity protein